MMFGRHPTTDVAAAWGARAIFTRGSIDILYDRQQMTGDPEARHILAGWVDTVGLPKLAELTKRLRGSETSVVEWDDGEFHIEASPQASYGYLYIGAWRK